MASNKSTTEVSLSKVPPPAKLQQENAKVASREEKNLNTNSDDQPSTLSDASKVTITVLFWLNATLDVSSHLALVIVLLDVIDYNQDDINVTILALIIYNSLILVAIVPTDIHVSLYVLYVSTFIHNIFLAIRLIAFIVSAVAIAVTRVSIGYSFWFLFQSFYLATTLGLLHQRHRKPKLVRSKVQGNKLTLQV